MIGSVWMLVYGGMRARLVAPARVGSGLLAVAGSPSSVEAEQQLVPASTASIQSQPNIRTRAATGTHSTHCTVRYSAT